MKIYRVKTEFIDRWTNEDIVELTVTENDIKELAKGWAVTVEELLDQVEYVCEAKYEISIDELAFIFSGGSRTENEIMEMYYKESTHDPEVVATYGTKEEAYEAWKNQYGDYAETKVERGNGSLKYLRCKMAFLEEVVMDADGEETEINPMEMAVEPFHDLEDVLERMKKKNGFFIDEYNDTYILTQQAYIDGSVDAPYFTATAINENEGTDSFGLFPVYEVVWYPTEDWLAGDRDDEGDACNWDKPDEITENCGGWDPEDGRII